MPEPLLHVHGPRRKLNMPEESAAEYDNESVAAFQQHILTWYDTFKRDLPWRGDADPYHILVSEVMLQQTQVDRVIPKYLAFLERFPTLHSLADASTGDVIREWRGLGYNRRALNLKRAAEAAVRDHGGRLPASVEDLEKLPGIGKYTASAVALPWTTCSTLFPTRTATTIECAAWSMPSTKRAWCRTTSGKMLSSCRSDRRQSVNSFRRAWTRDSGEQ